MRLFLLSTVLLIAIQTALFSQIMLTIPDLTVEEDQYIDVAVQVNGFTDVLSLQFSVTWDPTVLEFAEIKDFDLPTSGGDLNFGTTQTFNGILSFAWIDPELTGVTKSDGSTIYKISFAVIGQPGDTTTITVANQPVVIEAVNFNGEMSYTIDNGLLTIENPNATTDLVPDQKCVHLYQNTPNPFSDNTDISFDLNEYSDVSFRIFNNFGQILYTFQNKFSAGSYKMAFDKELFPTTGIYYYSISTNTEAVVKKLQFVK